MFFQSQNTFIYENQNFARLPSDKLQMEIKDPGWATLPLNQNVLNNEAIICSDRKMEYNQELLGEFTKAVVSPYHIIFLIAPITFICLFIIGVFHNHDYDRQ